MTEEPCPSGSLSVPLKEHIELLVDAKTGEIKLVMAERMEAVHTAYERHEGDHKVIQGEMEHLNQLRTDVTTDRGLFVPKTTFDEAREAYTRELNLIQLGFQEKLNSISGQIGAIRNWAMGAGAVLTLVFIGIQITIAIYK